MSFLKPSGGSYMFPAADSAQRVGPRQKVASLSQFDWTSRVAVDIPQPTELKRFTPSELAIHNTPEDCWMAIQGRVYNVTPYLAYHPGGKGQLMRGAGKDATDLYHQVHPWVNHNKILEKCFIGYLIPEPR